VNYVRFDYIGASAEALGAGTPERETTTAAAAVSNANDGRSGASGRSREALADRVGTDPLAVTTIVNDGPSRLGASAEAPVRVVRPCSEAVARSAPI
jgi:hypothetical protein